MLDLRDSKGETRINALNAQCGIKICNDDGIRREILEVELTKRVSSDRKEPTLTFLKNLH